LEDTFLAGNRTNTLELVSLDAIASLSISIINRKTSKTESMLVSKEEAIKARDWLDVWIKQEGETTDENNR
jgi:hypothetical protein